MENTDKKTKENVAEIVQNIIQSENLQPKGLEPVIIGAGGFAREVRAEVRLQYGKILKMYVDDEYWQEGLFRISDFDPEKQSALIAVGNPADKKAILAKLPEKTIFWSYISPRAYVGKIEIGAGSIICAGTIVTVDVKIGNHVHLNLNTTVGHDSVIGDFVTTAPNVNISGNVNIGNGVYLGTASCIREKLSICEDAIIGMNASVVKDILESGTYVGIPAKKIK
jgi:sugar O-acyltransferase (sialic acid O-acetyltransferase NeuD family)